MSPMILTLSEELVRALQDLADWEKRREISLAAELVRLALEASRPERDLRFLFAGLTDRERQLAGLYLQGYTLAQISRKLTIAPDTVKTHMRNIRLKLGVRTNAELRQSLSAIPPALFGEPL
ncbi:MAG: LuxR C-terminal-related transcriptional regulator [Anaerolineales bacterium]|nr:LuxR C-terminal-related transcriptional regulator [Anaerolineales bacterium]